MIRKVIILSFLLYKKNSRKYVFLNVRKNWEKKFSNQNVFFSFDQNFFLIWKKRKLRRSTLRNKSFSPSHTSFSPYILNHIYISCMIRYFLIFIENISTWINTKIESQGYHFSLFAHHLCQFKKPVTVKNFWFVKYAFSVFICTKNHAKIFKTYWEKWINMFFLGEG